MDSSDIDNLSDFDNLSDVDDLSDLDNFSVLEDFLEDAEEDIMSGDVLTPTVLLSGGVVTFGDLSDLDSFSSLEYFSELEDFLEDAEEEMRSGVVWAPTVVLSGGGVTCKCKNRLKMYMQQKIQDGIVRTLPGYSPLPGLNLQLKRKTLEGLLGFCGI